MKYSRADHGPDHANQDLPLPSLPSQEEDYDEPEGFEPGAEEYHLRQLELIRLKRRQKQENKALGQENCRENNGGHDTVDAVHLRLTHPKRRAPDPPTDAPLMRRQASFRQRFAESVNAVRKSAYLVPTVNQTQFILADDDLSQADEPAPPVLSYITLKVLIWDLGIAFGDALSDVWQGVALLFTEGKRVYVLYILCSWLPGLVAAVHLLSMYRTKLPWKKTLLFAVLLIVFYPLVPLFAYLNLLWAKPKSANNIPVEFRRAEYLATLAYSISGGIEAPIQFMFQVWMIFNGVLQFSWSQLSDISWTGWMGNTLYLPFTASLCMIFSVISIIKATIEINIIRVHIQDVTTCRKGLEFCKCAFDHMPYLLTSAMFRVLAAAYVVTYLNAYGFVPIFIYLLAEIVSGIFLYKDDMETIPLWLTSFASVFIPVCFTTKESITLREKRKMIQIQYRSFLWQSVLGLLCYGPAIGATMCIVLLPFEATEFQYNPEIIFGRHEFLLVSGLVAFAGVAALIFALKLPISSWFRCFGRRREISTSDEDAVDAPLRERRPSRNDSCITTSDFMFIVSRALLVLLLAAACVLPFVVLDELKTPDYVQIYYHPTSNHTVIIKAVRLPSTIPDNGEHVAGILQNFIASAALDSDTKKDDMESIAAREASSSLNILSIESYGMEGHFLLLSRTAWKERMDQILDSDAAAVAVVDEDIFRPSSPLPELWSEKLDAEPNFPIFLIRKEDRSSLVEAQDGLVLHARPVAYAVEKPIWKCSYPASSPHCLPAEFSAGHIAGMQYRTEMCFWGGRSCVGYDNLMEEQTYCNGFNIMVCPDRPGDDFGQFQTYTLATGEKRSFRSSPKSCLALENQSNIMAKACDSGVEQWIDWLDWQVILEDNGILYRSRRRYCLPRASEVAPPTPEVVCIYEEQDTDRCCTEYDACPDELDFCN